MRVTCVGARNERARSVSKSGDLNKCKIREGKYVVTRGDYGEIYYNLDEKVQKKKSAKDERRKRKFKKKTRNPFLPSSVQIHPLLLLPRVLLR